MRNWLEQMDLYKAIILVAVLALPVAGIWGMSLHSSLEEGRAAIRRATRTRGDIEEIGKYMKLIKAQAKSGRLRTDNDSMRRYFEMRIMDSVAPGSTLKRSNFEIKVLREMQLSRPRNAVDMSVQIDFKDGSKPLPLTRDFLNAVLFNCEALGNWKVRELMVTNTDMRGLRSKREPPPREIGDLWEVRKLVFARRLPKEKTNLGRTGRPRGR